MSEKARENRLIRSKRLLNKLKNWGEQDATSFFSNEKNLDEEQIVNRRNDRWLCADPSDVPRVMHTKFPATVMVLRVVSNEGHLMSPQLLPKRLRVNSAAYIEALETVVKLWIDNVDNIRPSHKA